MLHKHVCIWWCEICHFLCFQFRSAGVAASHIRIEDRMSYRQSEGEGESSFTNRKTKQMRKCRNFISRRTLRLQSIQSMELHVCLMSLLCGPFNLIPKLYLFSSFLFTFKTNDLLPTPGCTSLRRRLHDGSNASLLGFGTLGGMEMTKSAFAAFNFNILIAVPVCVCSACLLGEESEHNFAWINFIAEVNLRIVYGNKLMPEWTSTAH